MWRSYIRNDFKCETSSVNGITFHFENWYSYYLTMHSMHNFIII